MNLDGQTAGLTGGAGNRGENKNLETSVNKNFFSIDNEDEDEEEQEIKNLENINKKYKNDNLN